MVLTLSCGKYRFYDQESGTLANGLPRLLDMGQVRGEVLRHSAVHCNVHLSSQSWFTQWNAILYVTRIQCGLKVADLSLNCCCCLQCNDAYSALVVATELAKALDTDVNSLPLSLDISWFEQKVREFTSDSRCVGSVDEWCLCSCCMSVSYIAHP
jgi:hypothetical protein